MAEKSCEPNSNCPVRVKKKKFMAKDGEVKNFKNLLRSWTTRGSEGNSEESEDQEEPSSYHHNSPSSSFHGSQRQEVPTSVDSWWNPETDQINIHPNTNNATAVYKDFLSQENRVFAPCRKVLPLTSKVNKRKIRLVCISDTHNQLGKVLDKIPDGDVLIHAGDFTYRGYPDEVRVFNETLGQLPHKYKIVIAGNHELSFDARHLESGYESSHYKEQLSRLNVTSPRQLLTNCIYLEDSGVDVFGYTIYGSPWQPTFCGWAFNIPRGHKILEKWNKIPKDTDILVTHGPPLGHGDKARSFVRAGCVELLNTVEKRVKPKYHIFGHIHEAHGVTTNNETIFVNCSLCSVHYNPSQDPVIFDLPVLEGFEKK